MKLSYLLTVLCALASTSAGHGALVLDDLLFFIEPERSGDVDLLIDEVVLYDAGRR